MSEKYEVTVESRGEKWQAHLQIGDEAFGVGPRCVSREHAQWFADEFRAALATIVPEEEKPDGD